MIVESGDDRIIRPSTVHEYQQAAQMAAELQYQVMAGAPHSITGKPALVKQYETLLLSWFDPTQHLLV